MYNIILISGLFGLIRLSVCGDYCESDSAGLNRCHDGGCNSRGNANEICVCDFSENVMKGKYCGVYENKCLIKPCKNDGTCESGIGHHICKCKEKFYGVNCEFPIEKDDNFKHIRRPSIYYRIKSTLGEELYLLLVSESFGDKKYDVIIKGAVQNFRYHLDELRETNKIPDLIKLCSEKLSSKQFIVNKCNGPDNDDCQDMCNFIRNIYEHNKEVEFALIGPYFNTKTLRNKKEIFFDLYNEKKMGNKYSLELQLYSTVEKTIDYKIGFIQFIVSDIVSLCMPNIDFDYNTISQTSKALMTKEQSIRNIIPLKRNEKWTLYITVQPDSSGFCSSKELEMDHAFTKENMDWKIFNASKRILSYLNHPGLPYLSDSMMHDNTYLVIDNYKLPMGIHIMYLNITVYNTQNGKKSSNLYFHCIETILDGLVANITGPSPLYIEDTFLTLDASESYNPNEKDTKKDLLFTWECNIVEDEICKKLTTSTSKLTLEKKLEISYEYNFTLTLSVNENYIQSIGKPKEGIAKISVYTMYTPQNIEKKLTIECFENCVPLSNPSSIVRLEAKMNFIGGELLKWRYQEINNITETQSYSTDTIALTDVPNRMLIVKKNMLQYGTKYRFFATYSKYELENETYVTTISKPKAGICTILPDSGLAGITLFTISCMNFTNENTFEYYQKNKYDQTSLGVLLNRGNGTVTNLKLTSSNYLTVKVINKFGASIQVNLTVDVQKCNSHSMNNLFKKLKTNLMNKDISRTVSIIAILSDLLRENHINKFNKLFNTLAQIPIKNCIFCSVQFISILQKVIKDYNEVADGKMEINEISKMSKELLRISDCLYEYIKTSNESDKIIEVDKVEQIKKGLKTNIAIFQSNQFNITKPNNPSERFFWSSMDNVNIITESTDNLLKMFGKSIILELAPYYERLIICVEEIKNINACILSSKWIKNRTFQTKSNAFLYNAIDSELGNELITQGKEWGIIMVNVENDLIQSFEIFEDPNINFQIVSFDVSQFNQNNPRELIEYHSFEKPIHLNIKMNKTNAKKPKEYTIWVPSKNCSNLEFDRTLLVYRIDMINIQHLFVTLSDSTHDLRFAWLYDKRPDIGIMNNNTYTVNIMAGEKYEFTLKTFSERQNNIHYIGISANMDQKNTTQIYVSNINFSMDMFSPQCLYWNGKKWTTKEMSVGSKTEKDNIYCETNHVSLFGGLILTLPNITDPVEEVFHYEAIANNMVCIILVVIVFIIYLILLVWCIRQDKKDVSRGEIIILHDNYPGEDEVYLITVYTGNSLDAGTTANVCIQLYGTKGTSRAHWLYNHDSDVLQRFNDDWFIIFTPKSLGEIQYIRIWYDNYGSEPDWYCKHIEVIDVRGKRKWNFNVERWFSLLSTVGQIEHYFPIEVLQGRKRQVTDDVELTIREDYQWASVFFRHPRSLTTRSQRLSKIMCLLLSIMLISLIFYEVNETDEEQFLIFEITLMQVSISIQSSIIRIIMTFGISYCFDKSQNYQTYIEDQGREENNDDQTQKTWWRKLLFMLVKKKSYLPAQTEVKFIKNTQINYWLITGWTLCVLVYVISCVLIISHGLKLGQVKSLHWLMSIIISLIQDALFVEPIFIIISICVLYKFDQEQNIITGYQIKLANYRRNTRNQLRNVRLIRSIRESRHKYVYNPFTPADVEVLRNKQNDQTWIKHYRNHSTTCLLTFLISFCCIGALYSFDSPMHIIYANNINKLFLKNIVQSNTVDLEMLKKFLTTSLTGPLQIQEYYNGIPIVNVSKTDFNENNRRGWYNLYNSKLINGGIRLLQNRIRTENTWKIDVGNYKEGWEEISEINNITAWTYRSIPVIKYFGLWFPETHNSGFMLDLTGELSEYRKKLNTHLENGWLDNRTRNLIVEFQTYTPNIDCITVFNIQFQTTSGLLFTVKNVVYSVPSSSVFVSWTTFAFTLGFMIAFAITAMRLMGSVLFMVYTYDVSCFWTVYECAMLAVVLCTTFAVAGRFRLMEQAGEQYAALKETEFVASVTDMCRAHEHITALVVLVGIMALFRVFRLATYRKRVPYVERTLYSASGPVAAVAAYALIVTFGTWYCAPRVVTSVHGFFNFFVLGRNAFDRGTARWSADVDTAITITVFLSFNATVVSIITKYYEVSKTISR